MSEYRMQENSADSGIRKALAKIPVNHLVCDNKELVTMHYFKLQRN